MADRLSREEKQFNREIQKAIAVSSSPPVDPGPTAAGELRGKDEEGSVSGEGSSGVSSSAEKEQSKQPARGGDEGRRVVLPLFLP